MSDNIAEIPRRFQKVDPSLPEALQKEKLTRGSMQDVPYIFGQGTLEKIKIIPTIYASVDLPAILQQNPTMLENPEEEKKELLAESRYELAQAVYVPERRKYFVDFLNDTLADPNLQLPTEVIVDLHAGVKNPEKDFDPYKIPDDIYQQILEAHQVRFKQRSEIFNKEKLPQLKANFEKHLDDLISQGQAPLEARQNYNQRVEGVRFELADGLATELEDASGGYYYPTNTVLIPENSIDSADPISLQHTFNHEMLHATAGISRLAINQTPSIPDSTEYGKQKMGLSFVDRFHWLNEAVTDLLAGKEGEVLKYQKYIDLLNLLQTSGKQSIPWELFSNAYFENSGPKGQLPKWKALYSAINTSYRPGFLTELDKTFESEGEDAAKRLILGAKQ
jgi:hypothetical protein